MTARSPNQTCTGFGFAALRALGLGWRRDVWPGLTRWSLRPQTPNAGWRVYVHRFAVLDSEVHNHPWSWAASLILRGHYTERYGRTPRCELARVISRGCVNYIPNDRYHQVTGLCPEGAVWTLFVCGPSVTPDHEGGQ